MNSMNSPVIAWHFKFNNGVTCTIFDEAEAREIKSNLEANESMQELVDRNTLEAAQSVPVVGEPTDAAYKWMIANGAEPLTSLHKLGERLAAFLDEDQFSGCETLLLTAITAINTFVPVPAAELASLREMAPRQEVMADEIACAESALESVLVRFPDAPTDFKCIGGMATEAIKRLEQERDELRKALQIAFQHIDKDTHGNDHAMVYAAIAQGKGE